MEERYNIVHYGGLNMAGFVTWLVFLILKCNNVITFDWFWVWFPLWIVPAVECSLLIILAFLIYLFDNNRYK